MFTGEFQYNMDDKGRVAIPAKMREKLGETFMVTKGFEGCLFVYPMEAWEALDQKLRSLPFTQREARQFNRFFYASSLEATADKQGRIVIPANLREHAGLVKEVSIIGVGERIEIWDTARLDATLDETAGAYEDLAERLTERML